ncbi:MAG: hypothetical protein ABJB11_19105 [Ferruginibacter sp.]
MAKVADTISSQISNLPKQELEKLVLRAAKRDKEFHDFLLVNYFDKEYGEQDLFEQAKEDLEVFFRKKYKGYAEELQLAEMLKACSKRIVEFSKVCKNKHLECDLVMHVLEIPFSLPANMFQTCFTAYNYKVVSLLKRIVNLVEKKMHEDYKIQYRSKINNYLDVLHRTCSYLDYVNALPASV